MNKILILVEGSTEEKFVKEILSPHFISKEIYLTPINLKGVSKYSIIKRNLNDLLKDSSATLITTMLDYYALPSDFPNKTSIDNQWGYLQKVQYLEDAFKQDINHEKFLPYLQMHEFEALLFCDSTPFAKFKAQESIEQIASNFNSPEEINDSVNTAPSKRILKLIANYQKPLHGAIIAKEIGLEAMKDKCTHFNTWINKLENNTYETQCNE